MSTADTLRAAAARLREQAATAVKETRDLPMVKGVWLNGAHYLTTTPPVVLAMADLLDAVWDEVDDRTHAFNNLYEGTANCDAFQREWLMDHPALALATAVLAPTDPDVSRVRDHMNKES